MCRAVLPCTSTHTLWRDICIQYIQKTHQCVLIMFSNSNVLFVLLDRTFSEGYITILWESFHERCYWKVIYSVQTLSLSLIFHFARLLCESSGSYFSVTITRNISFAALLLSACQTSIYNTWKCHLHFVLHSATLSKLSLTTFAIILFIILCI